MASFSDFQSANPEMAAAAEGFLVARKHHILGTIRLDGSPRLSGTEVMLHDGELYWGSMPGSRKSEDLERDPRFSLHSGSEDPPGWKGDVKLSGAAVRADEMRAAVTPDWEGEPYDLFRAEICEVSLVRVEGESLIVDYWHHQRGYKEMRPGQPAD